MRQSRRNCVVGLACWAGMLAGAGSLLAQEPAIRPGSMHPAGTVAHAPAAGASFTIPRDYQGQLDAESGLFLVLGQHRAAVWAFSEGTVSDVAEVMGADLEAVGLALSPEETSGGNERMEGAYAVYSGEGPARLHGVIQRGPEGNVVGVAALGPPGSDPSLQALARDLVASVTWSRPQARDWQMEMAGTSLTGGSSAGDPTTDSADDVAAAITTDIRIVLCGDRSYEFTSERLTTVSSAEISGYGASQDTHAGAWTVVGDVAGSAWLVLTPLDREERYYAVEPLEGGVTLEGRPYAAAPAGC